MDASNAERLRPFDVQICLEHTYLSAVCANTGGSSCPAWRSPSQDGFPPNDEKHGTRPTSPRTDDAHIGSSPPVADRRRPPSGRAGEDGVRAHVAGVGQTPRHAGQIEEREARQSGQLIEDARPFHHYFIRPPSTSAPRQ